MLTGLVAGGPMACNVKPCVTAVVVVAWPDRSAIAGVSLGFSLETFLAGGSELMEVASSTDQSCVAWNRLFDQLHLGVSNNQGSEFRSQIVGLLL